MNILVQNKVLVVADKDPLGDMIVDVLGDEGIGATVVESYGVFEEILSELDSSRYDLVLLTNSTLIPHQIPALLSEIKIKYPEVKVAVLSGHHKAEFVIDLERRDIDDFFPMPFEWDTFIKRIHNLLPKKEEV